MGQTDSGGLIMEQALGVVSLIYLVATGFLVFNVSSLARKNKEILERLKSLEHGCMRDTSAFHSAIRQFENHERILVKTLNPKEQMFYYEKENGVKGVGTKYTSKLDDIHKKIEQLAKKVGYEYRNESTKKIDAGFIKTK